MQNDHTCIANQRRLSRCPNAAAKNFISSSAAQRFNPTMPAVSRV
jgi:hypothetical protein